ncbi:serine/threonine-protein kinase [Microbulbifer elongatus]|uniref:serine/threonine-protein kinase n=1 Tax=Microbulbifer elongatus TaxID=86173 RepID=UPI001CFCFC06|nr:serine/threonine-protein kinase [Microbulbifer elongatus]
MDIADPEVGQQAKSNPVANDRYRIQGTLGAGGMGVVYLAEDLKLHRQVAIKQLKEDGASQNARDRIQQEARLLAQLNHPNIVALHDVLEDQGNIALVMEYIEGTTLRAWMRERTPSLQQKLSLLMQICQGLNEAHNLGIIHRDLKSDNILITENAKGEPIAKITDFGIAKSQQLDEKTLTEANQLAGTITAMSPEQILGNPLDARSDLFSLGTIAFELLCGSRPFEKHEGGALAMANRITSEPHIPPQQAWAEIPEPLAILLDKLLAKDPAQRPQSAQIVYQGFELLHKQGLDSESEDFTATMTDLFTHHKVKSRRRWQRVLAGVAAAFVLGMGSYWGWKEFTRLEPQYIAVMPVEINGEIRGEENAKALTRTMVRQALMNSVSQLKASALVSFAAENGQSFDSQLQALFDKGVTDAISAKLQCSNVSCEIELQRIEPSTAHTIQGQNFTFITSQKQESSYQISLATRKMFDPRYLKNTFATPTMNPNDYETYLQIAERLESREINQDDLQVLESLIKSYPKNENLYRAHAYTSGYRYISTEKYEHISNGLLTLKKAQANNISESTILELELWLNSYNQDTTEFEKKLLSLKESNHPSAEFLNKYSRFLYSKGKYDDSLTQAETANKLNPSTDNLYLIALNHFRKGNLPKSEEKLIEILSKRPKYWTAKATLGGILIQKGDYRKAEDIISSIPDHVQNFRSYSNLGTAKLLQGKPEEALDPYTKAASLNPNNLTILGNIAEIYLTLNDTEKAAVYFQKIKEISNTKNDRLSRIYQVASSAYLGEKARSIALAHKLNTDFPTDIYVKYYSAQAYLLADEINSALYIISELLKSEMSADFFSLPIFKKICAHPAASPEVKSAICEKSAT